MSFFRRAGAEFLRVIKSIGDPAPEPNRVIVYAKDNAGVTQLYAVTDDGTINPLTPQQSVVISMGNFSIGAAADQRYLDRWNAETTAPLTEVGPVVAPRDGTLRNMFVRHQLPNGNGNSIVYTLRVNGVDTLLSVTLATGAIVQASDTVNQVPVLQGDRLTVGVFKALPIGDGQVSPSISMEYF